MFDWIFVCRLFIDFTANGGLLVCICVCILAILHKLGKADIFEDKKVKTCLQIIIVASTILTLVHIPQIVINSNIDRITMQYTSPAMKNNDKVGKLINKEIKNSISKDVNK